MLACVLGVLFAITISSPVHPARPADGQTSIAAQMAATVPTAKTSAPADLPAQLVRDLGTVSSGAGGLKGHLTTTWSEKLDYQLEMQPSDPAQRDAFAKTVSSSPKPLSVDFALRSAAGQVLCDQQVVLSFDPHNAAPQGSDIDRLAAQELSRERSHDVFRNVLDKDGKVASLASEGTMPCVKQQFDRAASWTFSSQFPDLRRGADIARSSDDARPARREVLTPSHPVHSATDSSRLTAVLHTPNLPLADASIKSVPSTPPAAQPEIVTEATLVHTAPLVGFRIEGADDIVDLDVPARRIETAVGMTFHIQDELSPAAAEGWLDRHVSVHYTCDQASNCTLALSDATVLRATMRLHESVSDAPPATTVADAVVPAPPNSPLPTVDLVGFDH